LRLAELFSPLFGDGQRRQTVSGRRRLTGFVHQQQCGGYQCDHENGEGHHDLDQGHTGVRTLSYGTIGSSGARRSQAGGPSQ
jgi:hypothetical protein